MSPVSGNLLLHIGSEKNLPALPPYEASETKTVWVDDLTRPDNQNERMSHGKTYQSTILENRQTVSATHIGLNSTCGSEDVHSDMPVVDSHSRKGWKPITLRYHILSCFVIFSFSLVAILEVLSYYSTGGDNENGGGLAFAADVSRLPTTASFFYLYLPTVVAVVYSMLWSWVDLDAKRLEPWFQLSKPEGAIAEDSLLLHYPFEFLAFVPISALRKRHVYSEMETVTMKLF